MPPMFEGNVRIYISPNVMQCAMEALDTSGVFNSFVASGLQEVLQLDNSKREAFNKLTPFRDSNCIRAGEMWYG